MTSSALSSPRTIEKQRDGAGRGDPDPVVVAAREVAQGARGLDFAVPDLRAAAQDIDERRDGAGLGDQGRVGVVAESELAQRPRGPSDDTARGAVKLDERVAGLDKLDHVGIIALEVAQRLRDLRGDRAPVAQEVDERRAGLDNQDLVGVVCAREVAQRGRGHYFGQREHALVPQDVDERRDAAGLGDQDLVVLVERELQQRLRRL